MEPSAQPLKGRAKMMLEMMKLTQTAKPGGEPSQAVEPPKPRGRAALIEKMKMMQIGAPAQQKTTVITKSEPLKVEEAPQEEKRGHGGGDSEVTCSYQGSGGQNINITANYIRLSIDANKGVFEYEVRFNPPMDVKIVRIKLVASQMDKMGNVKMFDGGSVLYLPIKLPDTQTVFEATHPFENSPVTMTVIYKKKKNYGECIHMFNVLFKRVMSTLQFSRVGRNYYNSAASKLIPQYKLEVLPGYAVAVDVYEGGLMVCLDTQHRVLRTVTVLEHLRDLMALSGAQFKKEAWNTIINQVVITKYNNKTYPIDDIVWDMHPTDKFLNSKGDKISYIEYYKMQYGIEITDYNQPLLLTVQKRKVSGKSEEEERQVFLIPEICHLTGLTDAMRKDFKVMKEVAAFTRVSPHTRMMAMMKFVDNVKNTPAAHKIFNDWGLHLEDGTIDLNARILTPEVIIFGRGNQVPGTDKTDWSGALAHNACIVPVKFHSWVVIHLEKDTRLAQEFSTNVMRLGQVMGCEINKPRLYPVPNDRTSTYVEAANAVINDNVQCAVFLCQTQRADLYSSIKKITCVQKPIASQVALSRNLGNPKKVRAITLRIALQINCKLGGSLWALKIPVKTWMVVGIDVFHSPGSKKSIAAIVGTTNDTMTSYYSLAIEQQGEITDALRIPFLRMLNKHRDNTGSFPTHVIIFRDGVGDGQLSHVKSYECKQFEEAMNQPRMSDIKLCYIVVQKRINTRVIAKFQGKLENPKPGTVLDHTITRKHLYDFYLVPQNVTQGTVTPTHYIVLHDTGSLKPDHVQKLSYKLCHLYYNWSGTIRVPAPCQYAHKLAFLVGQHIGKAPADILCDKLWYL